MDPLAHLLTGDEQVLADVARRAVGHLVRVVGDDRDLGLQRRVGRRVERLLVDQADARSRSAPPVIAVFIALTISLTLEFSEPVHWYEQPSSLQASSAPYLVGTKNGFVVTWLTSTNFGLPSLLKMPLRGRAALRLAATPACCRHRRRPRSRRSPAPPRRRSAPPAADRRQRMPLGRVLAASCHSSRSSASWTGSSSDIVPPPQWGVGNACAGVRHDTVLSPRDCALLSLTSDAVKRVL